MQLNELSSSCVNGEKRPQVHYDYKTQPKHFVEMTRLSSLEFLHHVASKTDVNSALDYYHVTVYNAFLDSLLQQLEDRFQPTTKAAISAMMLSALLPRYAIDACFKDVPVQFVKAASCSVIILMRQYSTWRLNLNLGNWHAML
jgi:hypothetical protein